MKTVLISLTMSLLIPALAQAATLEMVCGSQNGPSLQIKAEVQGSQMKVVSLKGVAQATQLWNAVVGSSGSVVSGRVSAAFGTAMSSEISFSCDRRFAYGLASERSYMGTVAGGSRTLTCLCSMN